MGDCSSALLFQITIQQNIPYKILRIEIFIVSWLYIGHDSTHDAQTHNARGEKSRLKRYFSSVNMSWMLFCVHSPPFIVIFHCRKIIWIILFWMIAKQESFPRTRLATVDFELFQPILIPKWDWDAILSVYRNFYPNKIYEFSPHYNKRVNCSTRTRTANDRSWLESMMNYETPEHQNIAKTQQKMNKKKSLAIICLYAYSA